ncbi:MAG: GNAT family N-acetyltransferase [Actinobacteria bacterium]|nr:GNAT family N-acetyltransferase [Actinomycetota bacterium]
MTAPATVDAVTPGDPALRAVWRGLQDQGAVCSPFLSWEWFSALFDQPDLAGGVRVLVVRDASRPLGLLPLEWVRGARGLRTVGIPGWRWLAPDHLDVVAAAGQRRFVARSVAHDLARRREWDVLDLDGLDADGCLAAAVRGLLRPPRLLPRAPEPVAAPYVDVRSRPRERLLTSRKLRSQVRRTLREAEAAGGGFRTERDPGRVEASLDELMHLHNARLGSVSAVFATAARRRFHRLAARRLAEAGHARVYRLATGSGPAALAYALAWGDRLSLYTMGVDPTAALSPGMTLVGQALAGAADEGFAELDLLRGEEAYKLRVASDVRRDVRLRVLRPTPRSLAAAGVALVARLRTAARTGGDAR